MTMLKKRTFDAMEQQQLFELMMHPDVFPYVRHKAYSLEEFYGVTEEIVSAEARGELLSRVIYDDEARIAGTINLFDITQNTGFLATWLGKPFQGKGINQRAKRAFLEEVFTTTPIDTVLMCIRHTNIRSQKAAAKLPYVVPASAASWDIFKTVKADSHDFVLLEIPKHLFMHDVAMTSVEMEPQQTAVLS